MKESKNAFDQYLCTPVSLVISTKVEALSEFKQILSKLYRILTDSENVLADMLRKLKEFGVPDKQSRNLVFAEFFQTIAFLRTIPAPVHNSTISIDMHGLKCDFIEKRINQLPEKNLDCIRTLIDYVDFKSILTCLKALLFDRSLVVLATKHSILYEVVEALK